MAIISLLQMRKYKFPYSHGNCVLYQFFLKCQLVASNNSDHQMVNLILSYPPLNHFPLPIHSFILKTDIIFFFLGSLIIVFVINIIGLSSHTYTVEYQCAIHL